MTSSPEHARLNPSGAHRWTECPGSVRLIAHLPSYSSSYALLGRAAHLLFEMCMRLEDNPETWIGKTVSDHVVDTDMADAVGHACDFVRGYLAAHPLADWYTERIVDAGKAIGRTDMWGTADLTIDNAAERELVVLDYKHGAGIYVEVVDNKQLMIYALGCLAENHFWRSNKKYDNIVLVIVQPRNFQGGPVRPHTISITEMVQFAESLKTKARATDGPDAPLVVGEHCRFCAASPRCPKLAEHALELAKQEFTAVSDQLSVDRFAYAATQIPIIRGWCKAVEEAAEEFLMRGGRLPGSKLVQGRASYYWGVPEDGVKMLLQACGLSEDQIAPRELISPAASRELLGGKRKTSVYTQTVAPIVRKNNGSLTLALETDPRPGVNAAHEFQPIEGDEV